jgi:predicted O-methyltransferase YrrM
MRALLEQIARVLPAGGDWCTPHKAQKLAALVVALEPRVIVEIGVWLGGSLVPMALAQTHVGKGGITIGIDPWSAQASIAGEVDEANTTWWSEVNYEDVRDASDAVDVSRAIVLPRGPIDLLHVDGNHTAQAIRDVDRFCPHVRMGGLAILDDVDWSGGHVAQAVEHAQELGFVALYPLDKGLVMQRIRGDVG